MKIKIIFILAFASFIGSAKESIDLTKVNCFTSNQIAGQSKITISFKDNDNALVMAESCMPFTLRKMMKI